MLKELPASFPLSLKALASVSRRPSTEAELPRLRVSLESLSFDPENLRAYRDICGFPKDGGVPIPYPQVSAIGLQMYLLTRPQFPLPLLGLVHLKNRITQERELNLDEAFGVQVGITGSKVSDKGLEFDLETLYSDAAGKAVWAAVATVLYRPKTAAPGKPKKPPAPEAGDGLAEYRSFEALEDIGRRYGKIAGDNNPIHLYPLTAKLFGFPRHIAHGMWSMARCCALLQEGLGHPPHELTTQFRQPLFLPARVALRHGEEGDGFTFKLISRDSDKTHLTGTLR
jgi:hypothetical protein